MPEAERNRSGGVADVARELYAKAYPEQRDAPGWIDDQANDAVRRIERARRAEPSTSAGARLLTNTVINHANPRERDAARRRLLAWIALSVAVVIVAVVLVLAREWAAQAAISTVGIIATLSGVLVTAALTYWSYRRARRERVLSCRVRIDVPFTVDVGEAVRLVGAERADVADPGVVVVRVANTGGAPIGLDDYVSPLALRFPGRTVKSVDATDFEPPDLERALPKEVIDGDLVTLPNFALLEPGNSFKLVIVLSGTKAGKAYDVEVEGDLRDGRITTVQGRDRIPLQTLVWGGLSSIGVGILAVVLLLNTVTPFTRLPNGVTCAPGSLAVAGSTAFGETGSALAVTYEAYCPTASVDVPTPGSGEGLERLLDAPPGAERLALTDGRFDEPRFQELTPTALAIVPFTLVGSDDVPVDSLSLVDVRRIFGGEARIWSDITGNAADTAEIRVVGRSPGSGTRQTLERKVLGVDGDNPVAQVPPTSDNCRHRRAGEPDDAPIVCERFSTGDLIDQIANLDGAIGYADLYTVDQATGVRQVDLAGREASLTDIRDRGYQFWAVEYVYGRQGADATPLAEAFKDFLFSPKATATMERFNNYACLDVSPLCEQD
ncbi:substrate-binding domain-containing protein [Promicromonospora xylanilytica]